jgi:hypothetical protein
MPARQALACGRAKDTAGCCRRPDAVNFGGDGCTVGESESERCADIGRSGLGLFGRAERDVLVLWQVTYFILILRESRGDNILL